MNTFGILKAFESWHSALVMGVLVCITGLALYLSTHRRMDFTDISESEIEEAKARVARSSGG